MNFFLQVQKMKLLNRKFLQNARIEDFLEIDQQPFPLFCYIIQMENMCFVNSLCSRTSRRPSVRSAKEAIKDFSKIVDLLAGWSI